MLVLAQNAAQQVRKLYQVERVLGHGNFGRVYLAKSVKDDNLKFAIKQLAKKNLDE